MLATILRIILAVAALVAPAVQAWIYGHPAAQAVIGSLAALLALFLPAPKIAPKLNAKRPEDDL